jgi:phage-related protein
MGVGYVVRRLIWVGSSHKDFAAFPFAVRDDMISALRFAQRGGKGVHAKPLQGFSGASVLEIVESDPSGTYRCMYTVKFQTGIYVLHAFQKKSRKGIATPKEHIDMVRRRLKQAAEMDAEVTEQEKKEKGSP